MRQRKARTIQSAAAQIGLAFAVLAILGGCGGGEVSSSTAAGNAGGGQSSGGSGGAGGGNTGGGSSGGTTQPPPPPTPTPPPPPPPPTTGSATLTWEAPTANTDQTCLTNLAEYRFYYGTNSGSYTYQRTINVSEVSCTDTGIATACGNIQACSTRLTGLAAGTWFFAVAAVNVDGDVSTASTEASTAVIVY